MVKNSVNYIKLSRDAPPPPTHTHNSVTNYGTFTVVLGCQIKLNIPIDKSKDRGFIYTLYNASTSSNLTLNPTRKQYLQLFLQDVKLNLPESCVMR